MSSKIEKLKGGKVKFKIVVEPAEMVKYFNQAFEKIAPEVKLPGFRPGKAPRPLVESSVGVSRIISDALDIAVNHSYYQALTEHEVSPITEPSVVIDKYPTYGATEAEVKENLEYTIEVAVFPEVKVGDYSKLKIELPKKEEAKEEDIQKILDNLLKQKANFKEVDRAAEKGDFVELTYEGTLKGVRIDAMCSKNHPMVLGEGTLIPGFEEEVVGMKKAEKKTFKIKFPKDYHSKEYAGKDAEFTVELFNLKEVVLPKLDNEFSMGFGEKTPTDLKKAIKKNLEHEIEHKHESEVEMKAIDKVLPLVHVEIPEAMIDRETARMLADYRGQLEKMGMTFESYLESLKKTEADLRKDFGKTAEKNVKVGLLIGHLIKELGLDPGDQGSGKKAIEKLVKELTK
ncbi:MAG: trigger factor [Patescibacteria group bacterium]|jgi:trigger factor